MDYQGPTAVTVRPIPCPVTGDIVLGIKGYNAAPLRGDNVELTAINHRLALTDMWVRGRNAQDAIDATTPWMWIPRTWTNKFSFYPSNGLNGMVYGASPTKTFDVKMRALTGDILTCTSTWNPQALADASTGVVTLGTCQFADPGKPADACALPVPPNPIVGDQFYAYKGGVPAVDCPSLNSQPNGCSIKTSGDFNMEWRHWSSFGIPGLPQYGFTGDCHSGSCIDTTQSTAFAGVLIGWVNKLTQAQYPTLSTLQIWAKCASGAACSLTPQIMIPCTGVTAPTLTVTNVWAQYNVDLVPLLAQCTQGFQVIQLNFPPNQRLFLDDIAFLCANGTLCANPVPFGSANFTGAGNGNPIPNGTNPINTLNGSGLSSGAIAGIVIGVLIGTAALVVVGLLIYRYMHQKGHFETTSSSIPYSAM